jgi:hypothetical protein
MVTTWLQLSYSNMLILPGDLSLGKQQKQGGLEGDNKEVWGGEREENGVTVIGDWGMGWRLDRGELESYAHTTVILDIRK